MHPADDVVAAMAADVRSAVAAASGRLQFTVRRIERGNVDLGRLIEELHDLDLQVRPRDRPDSAPYSHKTAEAAQQGDGADWNSSPSRPAEQARSADLKSAVSQVCNLRISAPIESLGSERRLAE